MGRIKIIRNFQIHFLKVILVLLFFPLFTIAQDPYRDSVYRNVMDSKTDALRFHNLEHNLKVSIAKREHDVTEQCFDELLLLAQKTRNKGIVNNLVILIENYFTNKGNYKKSIDYFFKLKKTSEMMGLAEETGDILDAIGVVYWFQGDFKSALSFYQEGIRVRGKDPKLSDLSGSYNNMGLIYRQMGDYKKAVEYYMKSLQLCVQRKDNVGTGNAYNNLGALYQMQGDNFKALYYNEKALAIRSLTNDSVGISISLGNLGSVYLALGNYKESEDYLFRSLGISERHNDLEGIKEMSENISRLFELTGKETEALKYYKTYIMIRDSLNSEESKQEALRKEMEYKFEQEEQKKAIENEAEKKRQKQYTAMVLIVLAVVLIFSFVLFRRFRLTQKQKTIIENQKKLVEEKQKAITDSIHYAKRIQTTLLPSEKFVERTVNRLREKGKG